MNEDTLNDLKQFITVTISQQLSGLREDMAKMEGRLSNQIQELSNSVAEAMTTSNEEVDGQLKDHETRIVKLETAAP